MWARECSWTRFVKRLPEDDPVRILEDAGDPNFDWEHIDWSGEDCGCSCHDHEYLPGDTQKDP